MKTSRGIVRGTAVVLLQLDVLMIVLDRRLIISLNVALALARVSFPVIYMSSPAVVRKHGVSVI